MQEAQERIEEELEEHSDLIGVQKMVLDRKIGQFVNWVAALSAAMGSVAADSGDMQSHHLREGAAELYENRKILGLDFGQYFDCFQ